MEIYSPETLDTALPGGLAASLGSAVTAAEAQTRHAGPRSSGRTRQHEADCSSNTTLIQSVQRALHLIVAVAEVGQPQSAKQLARKVGIALPTAYHLLRTLVHESFLDKTDDGYVLGPMVTDLLGRQQAQMMRNIVQVRSILGSLRDVVGGSAYLSLFRNGEIVLAEIALSSSPHQIDLWPGVQPSGHATAFGKCILARLDPTSRRDYLIRHELSDLTPKTVTDKRALHTRLESCDTVATDREEYRLGTSCIAVPIVTAEITGAVAISARSSRYDTLLTHLPALRVAADAIGFAAAGRG